MDITFVNANLEDLTPASERKGKNSQANNDLTENPTELDGNIIRNLGEEYLDNENSQDSIHVVLVNNSGINLTGGSGDDVLYGGENFDVLHGKNGNDQLEGFAGDDALYGDKHNDTLIGGEGNDILNGGAGYDKLIESGDANFILTNTMLDGLGIDAISKIESADLTGGAGDNLLDASSATKIKTKLVGGAGKDTLIGSQMGDSIYGGAGNDLLYGEMGKDNLWGNGGADIFALKSAMGTDTVKDFKAGMDRFGLPSTLNFSDLSITNNVGETAALIADTTNNNQLLAVVNNIDAVDLTAADFTTI